MSIGFTKVECASSVKRRTILSGEGTYRSKESSRIYHRRKSFCSLQGQAEISESSVDRQQLACENVEGD